ncbi:MAG: hypothetical protein EBZ59_08075 [Planctomycetia bacterium]|nr:hypothetical protein [Planctomycetia bacterium]
MNAHCRLSASPAKARRVADDDDDSQAAAMPVRLAGVKRRSAVRSSRRSASLSICSSRALSSAVMAGTSTMRGVASKSVRPRRARAATQASPEAANQRVARSGPRAAVRTDHHVHSPSPTAKGRACTPTAVGQRTIAGSPQATPTPQACTHAAAGVPSRARCIAAPIAATRMARHAAATSSDATGPTRGSRLRGTAAASRASSEAGTGGLQAATKSRIAAATMARAAHGTHRLQREAATAAASGRSRVRGVGIVPVGLSDRVMASLPLPGTVLQGAATSRRRLGVYRVAFTANRTSTAS